MKALRCRVGAALLLIALAVPACQSRTSPAERAAEPQSAAASDRTVRQPPGAAPRAICFRASPLQFAYERGDSGQAWPVEPVGGGVAIADFDGDGRPDLFFAQGQPLGRTATGDPPADCWLRNDGGQRFDDVSHSAAIRPRGYGIGITAADYDEDGFADVYVTRYGANTLWQNHGDGTMSDRTPIAQVGCSLWSVGAAFADLDNDGDLDLFVSNYFSFDPAQAPFARDPHSGAATYATAPDASGLPDVLYRNGGDGSFQDISATAGIDDRLNGMAVLASDFDRDGWVDLLVANDAQNNLLWHNRAGTAFDDVALAWGIAVNAQGQAEANMGIAYGDSNRDGDPDVLISHLIHEHDTLWRARRSESGELYFRDETLSAGLGVDSRDRTGWGTTFGDFDQDGWLDLVVANGHLRPERYKTYEYANPPLLWRNLRDGRFGNVTATAGPYFSQQHRARGLAAGDLDGDFDLDLVIVHHGASAAVLWNETPQLGAALLLDLIGMSSNRDAVAARIRLKSSDGEWVATIDGGGGYISTNHRLAHIGLGAAVVREVEVTWPSGQVQSIGGLPASRRLRIREPVPGSLAPPAPVSSAR